MQLRCMDMKAVIQILMGKLERQRWIKTVTKKRQKKQTYRQLRRGRRRFHGKGKMHRLWAEETNGRLG